MICSRCIHKISDTLPVASAFRAFSFNAPFRNSSPAATSINTRFSSHPTAVSISETQNSSITEKTSPELPISISPAGTVLKGLNFLKGRNDPIALSEEEYPYWLWTLLDKKKIDANTDEDADLFAKSKKLRRKAAKRQRKLEAMKLASGQVDIVNVPLTQQSIDLPSNEVGTFEGAKEADKSRRELRIAMRSERRSKIKETNYLKSV